MKSWAGIFLTGAFIVVLLSAMLRGQSGELRAVQQRLNQSEEKIAVLQDRLDDREHGTLQADIMAPSVQIDADGGMGGGTVIYSQPDHTYVITAFHVVQKVMKEDRCDPVSVRLYDGTGNLLDTVDGHVAAHDAKKDLALLRLNGEFIRPKAAQLTVDDKMTA